MVVSIVIYPFSHSDRNEYINNNLLIKRQMNSRKLKHKLIWTVFYISDNQQEETKLSFHQSREQAKEAVKHYKQEKYNDKLRYSLLVRGQAAKNHNNMGKSEFCRPPYVIGPQNNDRPMIIRAKRVFNGDYKAYRIRRTRNTQGYVIQESPVDI